MDGQWSAEAANGDMIASHVQYGRQAFTARPGMGNVTLLTERTNMLDEFEVVATRNKPTPWWVWATLAAVTGRAMKLW